MKPRHSPYMELFLSGVWTKGGSEDDRCLPAVSLETVLLPPTPAWHNGDNRFVYFYFSQAFFFPSSGFGPTEV